MRNEVNKIIKKILSHICGLLARPSASTSMKIYFHSQYQHSSNNIKATLTISLKLSRSKPGTIISIFNLFGIDNIKGIIDFSWIKAN